MRKITVFTPTYNRAYIIETLFNSLKRQTFTNFEWLIVDDGSTDNTESLINSYKKQNVPFEIVYIKQENKGKCHAINTGLDNATGRLFFTVDSDDYLTDDALEKIIKWESELPKEIPFCGLAANSGTLKSKTPNKIFETEYVDATLLERYTYIDGERAYIFYTDVHKQYKYPVFEGEKFMTEAVTWNRMAHDGFLMRFFNDIILIYEYQESGLTKSGSSIFLNNPQGYGLWLREKSEFMRQTFLQKLQMLYTFCCDLYPKYNTEFIAKCINYRHIYVKLMININKIKRFIFKSNKVKHE